MADLVAWLTQILDEDERQARAATEGPWEWIDPGPPHKMALVGGDRRLMIVPSKVPDVWPSVQDATFITRHDPAAVLADIAAKRRIIARALKAEADYNLHNPPWPGPDGLYGWLFRDLASGYAARPGYDEGWKP